MGNRCNIMHQLTNVQRQHADTAARADRQAGSMTHMGLTSVRGTSIKHNTHAQKREYHAQELRILRQGLSVGPHGSILRPNADVWQAEDRSNTLRLDACEEGNGGPG